ncbi:4,5-DOPA dioxygenase extradiol [Litorivivens lipolytica]|uniref:4,5-DOPA dioxygenase extradiol n=1 Tax=Litorivivens lipolytica TaxID=1524264 RepID=A0A7W4W3F2_9GAMM|nr:4,5-DOPA dioxygenase extradiol [Litorivivens lipolytica]MBB3046182.1 4,5-DOPA dioxygenase extradiol [Litorivivens lipolytica]
MNDGMIQPALFLAHGNPLNALNNTPFVNDWRSFLPKEKPLAILCVSAHWETLGTFVTANVAPKTIHDFSGFPPALYNIQYPCPGAPELAANICERSPEIQPTLDWGLDHGSWSLLLHLYPDADIPVLQMSLDRQRSPQQIFELGRSLACLRDEGVLLMGSGNIVHNIRQWLQNPNGAFDWAESFDRAVSTALMQGDIESLINYQSLPEADMAVPSAEHYLPLLFVLGAAREGDQLNTTDYPPLSIEHCSMRSLGFCTESTTCDQTGTLFLVQKR